LTTSQHRSNAPQRQPANVLRASQIAVALALGSALASFAQVPGETVPSAREIEQLWRKGESATAQQRLAAALAQRPTDPSLQFLSAVVLSETGHTTQAIAALEQMIESFPDLPEPYNNLAVLQAAAGQLDRARALLEIALRMDPSYRTAHENLGDVFVRLAQRAYEAASGPRSEPALHTKLRLTRELANVR
jgi:Flp pilus assembly protein TadD